MSTRSSDQALQRIHDSGGRVTTATRLMVSILAKTDRHLTADDLIGELAARSPGIAPSTVYRVLQRLAELDLLEHVCWGAGPAMYHLREHSHAHLACADCGAVTDVVGSAADALLQFGATVRSLHGFSIDPDRAAVLGQCRDCATRHERSLLATSDLP